MGMRSTNNSKPSEKDRYTIIAVKEVKAARAAGLNKIPAIVKDIDEKKSKLA